MGVFEFASMFICIHCDVSNGSEFPYIPRHLRTYAGHSCIPHVLVILTAEGREVLVAELKNAPRHDIFSKINSLGGLGYVCARITIGGRRRAEDFQSRDT